VTARSADVVIIGGGIIGCALAYRLAKAGVRVTVVERGEIGGEASSAAAGIVGPQMEYEGRPEFASSRFLSFCQDSRTRHAALAAELKERSATLILFGVKAADDDQQQVGPMTATLLGLPCVTGVASFEVRGDKVICHREVEGGVEVVEVQLPGVVTITKGMYDPRYASLKGIMAAKKKPLELKAATVAVSRLAVQRLAYPPERAAGRIVGQGPDAAAELVRLLREEANVL